VSDTSSPDVVAAGRGRFVVVDGTRRRPAYAARSADGTWVHVDGRVYVVGASRPGGPTGERGHAADDDAALSAPMPATVVSVNVESGQRVKRGDVLATLEAMKMELVVRAPRDGVVGRVSCTPGELVPPGVRLIELL
jgi:biotin carboxyl carrier protein